MQRTETKRTPRATGAARKPFARGAYVSHVAEPDRLGIVDGTCAPADYVPILWTDGTHSVESRAVLRATKAPLGFILYEGPSAIDGAPTVAIVTAIDASDNKKTGALVQSFILRADVDPMHAIRTGADASVCGQCPHRPTIVAESIARAVAGGASIDAARAAAPARCYVNVGRAPLGVYRAYQRGRYVRASVAFIAECVRGRRVRLGTYGDPAAIPVVYWRAIVAAAAAHTGYSHQWHAIDAAAWSPLVMASVDSVDEQRDAAARGYRTFRVSTDASDLMRGVEAVCPASAEGGRRALCADCMLCGGTARAARSIRIIDHASGWTRRVINIAAA